MPPEAGDERLHVVIVGGGFGGVGCARELAKHDDVRVSLVDRNNYHQFQPLLYQVATSQLAPSDIAYSLRKLFLDDEDMDLVLGEVGSLDLAGHAVTTTDGMRIEGDVLVLAAGSRPNFFRTKGAEEHAFPLYSLNDAVELRSRILGVFEAADNDTGLVDQGALNFVIVGGGPTGVELAGALSDLINETMTKEYHHLAVTTAQVHLVDLGSSLLAPFSDSAHAYASKVLERKGVRLHLGVAVTEVGPGHVALADGTTIRTRCVVWGGGIMAPQITSDDGLPHGRGGRIDVQPDLTVEGVPGVYVVGDAANIPGPDGTPLPQLGSVALQSGAWAADNIRAVAAGKHAKPFHYHDKGIMAMIGRGAAIAEVGAHRHELHGVVAFSAWLGVHSALMLGVRNRIDAFVAWGWDNFSSSRGPQVLDRADAAQIDWDEDLGAVAVAMTTLAVTTVDLARAQFATTSLYHFLFVPLTLGLAPLVAIMQTAWYRTGVDAWLRLTKFFGALLLINFAIGVATGLVQEFQFGMNWSVYSAYVGGVFGAPLAIEGLAAFFLEATFLGLWIFGWDRLSARVHLATIWLVAAGTWLSAYFILVANSWMQHPVGSTVRNGEAQLTNVWDLLTSRFAIYAFTHTMFVGVTTGALVVLGVSCWHLLRGRNVDLFRRAAALALIVAVPATLGNMLVGSRFATASTDYQPMKIAAAEALWNTEQPASFSLFQIGGFSVDDQKPSFDIEVPHLLSILATGTWSGKVEGLNPLQQQEQSQFGPGDYMPPVEPAYWGMRVMAYTGALMVLIALVGAWLYRTKRLERARWFLWTAVVATAFPFVAAMAGWVLTEMGRQPWIVWGLLKTSEANSPNVSSTTLGISLGVFFALYGTLAVVDVVLMRRFARVDPPSAMPEPEPPVPAMSF